MKKITYTIQEDKVQTLLKQDPSLKPLFNHVKTVDVFIEDDYFQFLVFTIIGQQLSVTVADTLFSRLKSQFDGNVTPKNILSTEDNTLREIGLSYRKIAYLKALALSEQDGYISKDWMEKQKIETIKAQLLKIKGIGPWTIEMFLMFSLGYEDVFSVGDLGLRNAYKQVMNTPDLTNKEIETISLKWKPYRSIVAHYLWKYWDELRHET
ncbi:MAG: DNA-3-methyladenine glycosylase family protein [Bacillota bacterium]